MHHSFATWALDAGLSTFDLSRYMRTSVEMIDRTYGHLAQGAEQTARAKLDAAYAIRLGHDRATGREREGRLDGRDSACILKRAMGLEPTTRSLGSRAGGYDTRLRSSTNACQPRGFVPI